jgi:hypothetical protein
MFFSFVCGGGVQSAQELHWTMLVGGLVVHGTHHLLGLQIYIGSFEAGQLEINSLGSNSAT